MVNEAHTDRISRIQIAPGVDAMPFGALPADEIGYLSQRREAKVRRTRKSCV